MMAAVCDVKDSLLVAALVNVNPTGGENLNPKSVSDDANGEHSSSCDKDPSENEDDQSDNRQEEEREEQLSKTTARGKSKDAENAPSISTSSKPKPSQMQILIWRVEAMADALREDLRDFTMPLGTL